MFQLLQLESENIIDKNLEDCERSEYKHQASDNDYKNSKIYNRGHLFPSSHAFDESDKMSTFTLTNIVPQAITFNNGSWEKMENCVKYIMENYCFNKEGYVVTGAQPSKDKKPKINIPSMLWSAFCCYNKDKKKLLAGAHWGDNTAEESTSQYLKMKTLEELKKQFGIEAFPGTKCPHKETAAKSYPEITKTCQSPSPPLITSAPPTTTNQQQFIDFLYGNRKFHNNCKKVLKGTVISKGPQAKNLFDLCLKFKKHQLRSENIDESLKELLLKLLNKSDL